MSDAELCYADIAELSRRLRGRELSPVELTEAFLERTENPHYAGVVDYGDRAEHCWNGDHDNPNAISRLRYNSMYVPRILQRIQESAPAGADLTSWRY